MKVLQLDSTGHHLTDISEFICKDFEIIIDVKFSGICGSDIGNIFGTSSKPTTKIGHEISGIVFKIGKNITDFKIGDRVVLNHHYYCKKCHYCHHNNQTMCNEFGNELDPCGIAQRIRISEKILENKGVFKIPHEISLEIASLIEPLSCCIRGWGKFGKSNASNIVIFGLGPIGHLFSLLAIEQGIKETVGFDINPFRREFFSKKNCNISFDTTKESIDEALKKTNGIGYDCAVVATSDFSCLPDVLTLIRKGGKILLFGEPAANTKINLDISAIYEKEISLLTSYASTNTEFDKAIDMIAKKQINLDGLITHKFNIDDAVEAIDFTKTGNENLKVLISCD